MTAPAIHADAVWVQMRQEQTSVMKRIRREWLVKQHARRPRCTYCERKTHISTEGNKRFVPLSATLDHYMPLALGGRDNRTNWKLACADCNSLKGDMHPDVWMKLLTEDGA